jgi:hypothetical protein
MGEYWLNHKSPLSTVKIDLLICVSKKKEVIVNVPMRIRQQDNGSQADNVIITLSKQKCSFKNTLGNFLQVNKIKRAVGTNRP